jgi:hypothetical protein
MRKPVLPQHKKPSIKLIVQICANTAVALNSGRQLPFRPLYLEGRCDGYLKPHAAVFSSFNALGLLL